MAPRLPLAILLPCAGLFLLSPGAGELRAQDGAAGAPGEEPRLGVLLVVDQLRADLLDRYRDLFTRGLRRLLDEGRVFPNATHDHLVTETAPGHATLATGTFPARHGVVGNQWSERSSESGGWVAVENVIDHRTAVVGAPTLAGASPRVLERDGLADWIGAAGKEGRVVSVSGKARGAVLLGGRDRHRVVWFEPTEGQFTTSTWYADDLPGWVEKFNRDGLQDFAADSVWESTVPPAVRSRSRPDTAAYESDGVHSSFPHRFEDEGARGVDASDFWVWFANTPMLDEATLLLARRALDAEGLGRDDAVDLLAVSLPQTDRVGHAFGPLSREQLDNLLRLDVSLGAFFDHLDRSVGPGGWTVAFSSDHGAQNAPEYERDRGKEGSRLTADSLASLEGAANRAVQEVGRTDPDRFAEALAREVEALPWMARAWSHRALERGEAADSFEVLARRSHRTDRPTGILGRLGVQYLLEPGVMPFGYGEGGSTHQSGYHYDRHVPFVLMGAGVVAGVDSTRVSAADLAPTLAEVLGIPAPDDLDGVARPVR